MMRWTGERSLWLTLAALAVLLVLLGALQYRWVDRIGQAERERRRTQLARSAWRLASGLDRELGRAGLAFRLEPARSTAERLASLSARLESWQQDDHAPLVAQVRLALVDNGALSLWGCSSRGCRPESWPADLEALRTRLARGARAPGFALRLRAVPLFPEPPTLLVPLLEKAQGTAQDRPRSHVVGVVLVSLDSAFLAEQVLPDLVEDSLGRPTESDLAVSLVRRRDRAVLYTNEAGETAEELQRADFEIPAPFATRAEASADRHEPDQARRQLRRPSPREWLRSAREEDAPWLLLVRHRGGSLEQAVAAVWRRNMAVGLGVLALLGAAGILLATGAQRARGLARQQLEFVAGVTHELNTPLAALRSAGQNLADGIVTDPQQVRRYGALIEREGSRLGALVSQVLDFAGIESGSRPYASDRVELGPVVDAVLADLRLVLQQAGLEVERDVPARLAVTGDAAALRRMLANLLGNAAKFAGSGGRVTVRAATPPGGRAVVLRIEDRGPGIPASERQRVFEPFYRGGAAQRNETPGSGLGLSLVKRVVEAHRGRVRIEERDGGGAAVVVELPAAPLVEGSP